MCFIEGLTFFNNKFFLYYGTADSRLAVATAPADVLFEQLVIENPIENIETSNKHQLKLLASYSNGDKYDVS